MNKLSIFTIICTWITIIFGQDMWYFQANTRFNPSDLKNMSPLDEFTSNDMTPSEEDLSLLNNWITSCKISDHIAGAGMKIDPSGSQITTTYWFESNDTTMKHPRCSKEELNYAYNYMMNRVLFGSVDRDIVKIKMGKIGPFDNENCVDENNTIICGNLYTGTKDKNKCVACKSSGETAQIAVAIIIAVFAIFY